MKTKAIFAIALSIMALQSSYADTFSVSSEGFIQGKKLSDNQVFDGFGCQGNNLSPAIYWHDVPQGTKSFAVSLYDPDAPTGSGFWHWTVLNIPNNITRLKLDAGNPNNENLPVGAYQVRNDYGTKGFGGACPPEGDNPHHYELTIHALDVESINLPAEVSPAVAGFMIRQHQLESTTVTAHYMR